MITFFTTGKPFRGHDGIIQRNALKSWTLLHPDVEVILFGDEEGAAEVCAELGLRHEPEVERYQSKLPYVNSMFARAQQIARHEFLCYSNCDIVLFKDFVQAFERGLAWKKKFLMVAQRWDVDVKELIDFAAEGWDRDLRQRTITTGLLQIPDFMDFFVFPRGLYDQVPPLIVGYAYWDHWIVWKALSMGSAVLDASPAVLPVHQNHSYTTTPERSKGSRTDSLALRNFELSGNGKQFRSMRDSTHRMNPTGRIRRTFFRRQLESELALKIRQAVAEKTFKMRDRLGLRRRAHDKIRVTPPPFQD